MAPALAAILVGVQPAAATLRLDHVPIVVHDIGLADRTFRDKLGFTIKPGRLNDNTLRDDLVKFFDGTSLELITAARPEDETAEGYVNFLAAGEGLDGFAVAAGDVDSVAARIRPLAPRPSVVSAGPYSFLVPQLSGSHVFFIDYRQTMVEPVAITTHANTARGLLAVWVAADSSGPTRRLLEAVGAKTVADTTLPLAHAGARRVELQNGAVYLTGCPARQCGRPAHAVLGITVEVGSLTTATEVLERNLRRRFDAHADRRGRSVLVPPSIAHGIWLELLEPAPAPGKPRTGPWHP